MTPRATYRLQFRNGMDFGRAVEIVPYLKRLGISHLYASPIFTAASGSTHGYDVIDHNEIDPALGGRAGFDRLSAALKEAGLELILDIVPNHMAASLENAWWRSAIEWGADSPFGSHFDIDWREPLTLPILGQTFEDALSAGELTLRMDRDNGTLALAYFETPLPLHPSTYASVLSRIGDPLGDEIVKCAASARAADEVPFHEAVRGALSASDQANRLDVELARLSRDASIIQALHDAQSWRLDFWKNARNHLSYRRFFEVTGLVGVWVEDYAVFDDVHRLILNLVRAGDVDGLRVDHVDGLADPKAYLERLRDEIGPDVYLTVEKILGREEALPADWPIDGTTGYEFIADLADLLTDAKQADALDEAYATAIGKRFDYALEELAAKRAMVYENFATELTALVRLASKGDATDCQPREDVIRDAIAELIIAFPVYRTYGDGSGLAGADLAMLDSVASKVRHQARGLSETALAWVLRMLRGDVDQRDRAKALDFRIRFQQLTGPVMAKAIEDTLFFRFNRLIARNEVGGDPARQDGSIAAFHAAMARRVLEQPRSMLATTTHDTKRGEDARARLYALSEAPGIWTAGVARWRRMHADLVQRLPGGSAPDADTEWMIYQALAGVWPAGETDAETLADLSTRFAAYVEKSLREAKLRTSWTQIDKAYEQAVLAYASRLTDPANESFIADFTSTLAPFARAGAFNSLSQTLLKLTVPGVPDIYQGSEMVDDSLVDPDNRRAIDFQRLGQTLSGEHNDGYWNDGLIDGTAKQKLIARCLAFRADQNELFTTGSYTPLDVSGVRADHVVAFMREHHDRFAIVIVPRFTLSLSDGADGRLNWGDTAVRLPGDTAKRTLHHVLTGAPADAAPTLPVADLLTGLPVGLLVSAD